MGLFGRGKKKKKKRAKPPRLEPVPAAPIVQPVVELASPPTDIQPDMVIEMDMDMESVAPAAPAAQPVVELVSPPQVQPAAGIAPAQPTDWQKRSEKPLVDIHRRLDSMLEEDSQSLEERYKERFGDNLPKSVAGDTSAKTKPAAKKEIRFKPRSGIKFTSRAATAPEPEEPAAKAEEVAAEAPISGDTSPSIGSRITGGARNAGSRTKGAIGSGASAVGRGARGAGSAVGRGVRSTGSAIGSGASKVAGLFRRGDKKPAAKKAPAKKKAVKPDYSGMKVAQLKAELKKKGLSFSGKKADLVKRLQKA
ncbi:MAG: SAP domain-containing protein [Candidatus Thermoplasmatota archaeon]|nr:SAP domain-containing protein [Candidatus Thermoplasmatota archaeon]